MNPTEMDDTKLTYEREVGNYQVICSNPFVMGSFGTAYLARNRIDDGRAYIKVLEQFEKVTATDSANLDSQRFVPFAAFRHSFRTGKHTILHHGRYFVGLPVRPRHGVDCKQCQMQKDDEDCEQCQRIDPRGEIRAALERKDKDPKDLWKTIREIGETARTAHRQDIVPLNISPHNLLYVGTDSRVRLLDVGLDYDATDPTFSLAALPLTAVPYMAPERLEALKARKPLERPEQSDIYSIGMTAYELLTGSLPFKCKTVEDVERAVLGEKVRLKTFPLKPVNHRTVAFISRCLEKNPEDRFESLDELLKTMDAISDPFTREPTKTSTKLLAGVTATLVIGMIAFGLWVFTRPSRIFNRSEDLKVLTAERFSKPFEMVLSDHINTWASKLPNYWLLHGLESRVWVDGSTLTALQAQETMREALGKAIDSCDPAKNLPEILDLVYWRHQLKLVLSDQVDLQKTQTDLVQDLSRFGVEASLGVSDEKSGLDIPEQFGESAGGVLTFALLSYLNGGKPSAKTLHVWKDRLDAASTSELRPDGKPSDRWPAQYLFGLLANQAGDSDAAVQYFLKAASGRPALWPEEEGAPKLRPQNFGALLKFVSVAQKANQYDLLEGNLEQYVEIGKGRRLSYLKAFPKYQEIVNCYLKALVARAGYAKAFGFLKEIHDSKFFETKPTGWDQSAFSNLIGDLALAEVTAVRDSASPALPALRAAHEHVQYALRHTEKKKREILSICLENELSAALTAVDGPGREHLDNAWNGWKELYEVDKRPTIKYSENSIYPDSDRAKDFLPSLAGKPQKAMEQLCQLLDLDSKKGPTTQSLDCLWTAMWVAALGNPRISDQDYLTRVFQGIDDEAKKLNEGDDRKTRLMTLDAILRDGQDSLTGISEQDKHDLYVHLARANLHAGLLEEVEPSLQLAQAHPIAGTNPTQVDKIRRDLFRSQMQKETDTDKRLDRSFDLLATLDALRPETAALPDEFVDVLAEIAKTYESRSVPERNHGNEQLQLLESTTKRDYRRFLQLALHHPSLPTERQSLFRYHLATLQNQNNSSEAEKTLMGAIRSESAEPNLLQISPQDRTQVAELRKSTIGVKLARFLSKLKVQSTRDVRSRFEWGSLLEPDRSEYVVRWGEVVLEELIPADGHPYDFSTLAEVTKNTRLLITEGTEILAKLVNIDATQIDTETLTELSLLRGFCALVVYSAKYQLAEDGQYALAPADEKHLDLAIRDLESVCNRLDKSAESLFKASYLMELTETYSVESNALAVWSYFRRAAKWSGNVGRQRIADAETAMASLLKRMPHIPKYAIIRQDTRKTSRP